METQDPAGSAHRSRIYGNKVLSHLLLLLGTVSLVSPNTDCPIDCNCKYVANKYVADCHNASYTHIPKLDPQVNILNLGYNYLPNLQERVFYLTSNTNLQKICLKDVSLKTIHRQTFDGLRILVELDLSYNSLSEIPLGSFSENEKLRILNLDGNPLKTIPNFQFSNLASLRTLSLVNCELHTIEQDAFHNLILLEKLNLEANELRTLNKIIFEPARNLKTLMLNKNPWNCDCDLREFRTWYLNSILATNDYPLCMEPKTYRDMYWNDAIDLDFSCHPESTIIDGHVLQNNYGENATIHCKIIGYPEPEVIWKFNGEEIIVASDDIYSRYIEDCNIVDHKTLWSNLTVVDLIEQDSGLYECLAVNGKGSDVSNTTIILNHVYVGKSLPRGNNYWFAVTGFIVTGMMIFILITSTVACACRSYNIKLRRKLRRQAKMNKSDQDKQLLDMSSSNTEQLSRINSYDRLGSRGNLLKHPSSASMDIYNTRRHYKETSAIIPLSQTFQNGVYPPPPEFSNMPQSNTLGNIYISVSLTEDPNISIERYPDLLNHRSSCRNLLKDKPSTSEIATMPFATLPRRNLEKIKLPKPPPPPKSPKYDNMGKRITIGGSTTLEREHNERDEIPTPPPPPLSEKPDNDYVPL